VSEVDLDRQNKNGRLMLLAWTDKLPELRETVAAMRGRRERGKNADVRVFLARSKSCPQKFG